MSQTYKSLSIMVHYTAKTKPFWTSFNSLAL